MADEEDLLGPMNDLGEEEGEEEEGEGGSPLMKYLPLVAVVLVVQIVIAVLIGWWFFAPSEEEMVDEGEATEEQQVAQVADLAQEVIWEGMDPIVVNPAGTGGIRFANVHIHLGLTSPLVLQAIEQNGLTSRIRDRLISVLAEQTIDHLDPSNHENLKEQMRIKLNEFLSPENNPPAIKRVYFQGFVLQ